MATNAPPALAQAGVRRTASPALPPPPNVLTNESLQAYMNELKAAAARTGAPPPAFADMQAAIAAYANGGQATANPSSSPFAVASQKPFPPPNASPQLSGNNPLAQLQQQQQIMQARATLAQDLKQLTPAQISALPQIPIEMKQQIEKHVMTIRGKLANGSMSQEQASAQMKRLQEVADQ